jgi:hypothetical protein
MPLTRLHLAAPLLVALSIGQHGFAQQPARIPIRTVASPTVTSVSVRSVDELREIAHGIVLVNDGYNRSLITLDSALQRRTILADTMGAADVYPRIGKLIPYAADSTLFYDADVRSLKLIDPDGKFVRVLALPRPQDFNMMTHGSPVATDAAGDLVYQGRGARLIRPVCGQDVPPDAPRPAVPQDSAVIIRANFERRSVDTVGIVKTAVPDISFPILTLDAGCRVSAAKVRMNPSIPPSDSWTVTARGAIAIVRVHDYHVDWIDADGTRRSTPKMAFDWRRLTDAEKQSKIDSARHIVDSLTEKGGFRLKACQGGRSIDFSVEPPDASGGGDVFIMGRAGAGRDGPPAPNDCQTVTVTAEFVPVDSMADYIAPIRESSVRADLDGNVWILPATSASAKGGLLYDVVSPAGEIVERVQLPAGRSVAGFGRGGVLYLLHGDYRTAFVIEKVKVMR